MKFVYFEAEPFNAKVFVFWDCTPTEAADYVKANITGIPEKIIDVLRGEEKFPPLGVTLNDRPSGGNSIIWLRYSPTDRPDIVAHEAVHAAFNVVAHWAIDVDDNAHELLAVLTGFIVRKIEQRSANGGADL